MKWLIFILAACFPLSCLPQHGQLTVKWAGKLAENSDMEPVVSIMNSKATRGIPSRVREWGMVSFVNKQSEQASHFLVLTVHYEKPAWEHWSAITAESPRNLPVEAVNVSQCNDQNNCLHTATVAVELTDALLANAVMKDLNIRVLGRRGEHKFVVSLMPEQVNAHLMMIVETSSLKGVRRSGQQCCCEGCYPGQMVEARPDWIEGRTYRLWPISMRNTE
jgi:hypothetical protein